MKKIITLTCLALLFLTCCKSTKNTSSSGENLDVNTEWRLKTLKTKIMTYGENDRIVTIKFNPEAGQVGGCSGCNSYFGIYSEPQKGKLAIESVGATKMACPQPMMEIEHSYLSTLRKVNGYQITDGILQLLQDENVVLTFEKQETTEQ